MKAHIVYAHPEPASFVAAMRGVAENSLSHKGYDVTISDLYAMEFNPIASRADFRDMEAPGHLTYTAEQRHGYVEGTLADDIKIEVDRVLAADLLVLVFPVWWFSVPAIMKGWIDRVILSGPFYSGRKMYEDGGMRGKRAMVIASLGGKDKMFGPNSFHGELEDGMLRHLLRGTLGVVGYEVLKPFFAYHAPYISGEGRADILEQLGQHLERLDTLPILHFGKAALSP